MARKRMIDPEFWDEPKIGKLPDTERIFIIGCISHADDEGRLLANPAYLKSCIWKYHPISINKVKKIRDEVCQKLKGIQLYNVDDLEIIQLSNWEKYQTLRKDRMTASWLPKYQPNGCQDVNQNDNQPTTKCPHKLSKVKLREVKKEIKKERKTTNKNSQEKSAQFLNLFFSKTQKNKNRIPTVVAPILRNTISKAVMVLTQAQYEEVLNRCIKLKGTDQSWEYYLDSVWREAGKIEHGDHKNEVPVIGKILKDLTK